MPQDWSLDGFSHFGVLSQAHFLRNETINGRACNVFRYQAPTKVLTFDVWNDAELNVPIMGNKTIVWITTGSTIYHYDGVHINTKIEKSEWDLPAICKHQE